MVTLRRIGIFSAGRVGFFFGVATSIMNVAFAIFWLVVVQGVPISVLPPDIWGQIAFNILISSFVVSLGMGAFAFLYNLSPGFGGLKLEFEMHDGGISPKRKNDDLLDDLEEID
ncbi:MAG: hypothetical protein AAFV93_21900 [Chloroflexota bacterium]